MKLNNNNKKDSLLKQERRVEELRALGAAENLKDNNHSISKRTHRMYSDTRTPTHVHVHTHTNKLI